MRTLAAAEVLALFLLSTPATGIAPPGLVFLRGDLHAHTCYSDGEGTPAQAFALAKAQTGLDFFAVTEHSEWLEFPFCADAACALTPLDCFASPLPERTEWDDVLAQAEAATDGDFIALRGFEWSHPHWGHMNVVGSSRYLSFLATPAMPAFYAWLALPPPVGGSDGVASFNHPGREAGMFDGFAHSDLGEPEVQLLEVYNRGNLYEAQYYEALDAGWMVAATGVSDSHSPQAWLRVRGQTVVLAEERTRAGVLGALDAMRTFATNDPDLEVVLRVNGALMGSTAPAGPFVQVEVRVRDPSDGVARVTLLTRGARVAASLDAGGVNDLTWSFQLPPPEPPDAWFVAKVEGWDGQTAHTAPVRLRQS